MSDVQGASSVPPGSQVHPSNAFEQAPTQIKAQQSSSDHIEQSFNESAIIHTSEIPDLPEHPKLMQPNTEAATELSDWMIELVGEYQQELYGKNYSKLLSEKLEEPIPEDLLKELSGKYPDGQVPANHKGPVKYLSEKYKGNEPPEDWYDDYVLANPESAPISETEQSEVVDMAAFYSAVTEADAIIKKMLAEILRAGSELNAKMRDVTWDNLDSSQAETDKMVEELRDVIKQLKNPEGAGVGGLIGAMFGAAAASILVALLVIVVAIVAVVAAFVTFGASLALAAVVIGALISSGIAAITASFASASAITTATTKETLETHLWNMLPFEVPLGAQIAVEIAIQVALILVTLGAAAPAALAMAPAKIAEAGVKATIMAILASIKSAIMAAVNSIKTAITNAISTVINGVIKITSQSITQTIKATVKAIIDAIIKAAQSIKSSITSFTGTATSVAKSPAQATKDTFNAIKTAIQGASAETVFNAADNAMRSAGKASVLAQVGYKTAELTSSGRMNQALMDTFKSMGMSEEVAEEMAMAVMILIQIIAAIGLLFLIGFSPTNMVSAVTAIQMIGTGSGQIAMGVSQVKSAKSKEAAAESMEQAADHESMILQIRAFDQNWQLTMDNLLDDGTSEMLKSWEGVIQHLFTTQSKAVNDLSRVG